MNNIVRIENSESILWDATDKLIEIIAQLQSAGTVTIQLNHEGPCANAVGLYKLLDTTCDQFKFNKADITIVTSNLIEQHDEYKIKIQVQNRFIRTIREFVIGADVIKNAPTSHFGLFVGRSNWARLWLASYLITYYSAQSDLTFNYGNDQSYWKTNLGFDELSFEIGPATAAEITAKLLAATPIKFGNITQYPIDGRKVDMPSLNLVSKYADFFAEIVCETYTVGTTFFPTEKIWRPIMCKTPFIVQGPTEFLANLKVLGIKTFDKWWDESYDYQVGKTKIESIIKVIDFLSLKTVRELEIMYNEMLPILEHNYTVLMNLTPEQMLAANYVK